MNRIEKMAFNSPSMRDFVAEVLNIQERFGLPEGKHLYTAKELRELFYRVHEEAEANG